MNNEEKPTRLYKYQSYNVQTIDNLVNRILWFSKPIKFNDPYECYIPNYLPNLSKNEWEILYLQVRNIWHERKNDKFFEEDYDNEYKQFMGQIFKDDKPEKIFKASYNLLKNPWINFGWKKLIENEFGEIGISCFSEKKDDPLMWSHYADGHRGFCLEFDAGLEPFSKALKVSYSELLLSLKPENEAFNLFKNLATHKFKGWESEQEWRLFVRVGETEYGFNPNSLISIYFGSEMPLEHQIVLGSVASKLKTKLYIMRKDDKEYELQENPVEYDSLSLKNILNGLTKT